MLRPFHEMNGNWYPWGGTVNGNSPAEFRAAWRHVHDIFAEEGVTNVTWVWSINWESFPNTYANRHAAYYPGAEHLDWTSLTGFNRAKSAQRPQGRSFANLYTKPLAYLATLDKPVVISEIGCNSNVNKAAWIRDAYNRVLLKHPHVKGIVYYDKRESSKAKGTQNWQISSSKASERAYRSAISSRMFIGGSSESLLGTEGVAP
jgi:beta-mannanase